MTLVPRSALLLAVFAIADGFQYPSVFMTRGGIRHGRLKYNLDAAAGGRNRKVFTMCSPDALDGGLEEFSDNTLLQPLVPSFIHTASRRSVLLASAAAALPVLRSLRASAADASPVLITPFLMSARDIIIDEILCLV